MNGMDKYIVIVATILVLLYSVPRGSTAEGANLTPDVTHPVLDKLVAFLDPEGIDVRPTWDKGNPSGRPTLAPLNGFPAEVPKTTRGQFVESFRTGASGTVLAIQPASNSSLDVNDSEQRLLSDWLEVPPERRVFISFSRSDIAAARAVRDALRHNGYRAFIYIKSRGETPALAPEKTGAYFKTAGHHFVIDSRAARSSPAVAYEAHWVTKIPPPSPKKKTFSPGDSALDGPKLARCWECCTYQDNVEVGCVFVGCGEEAHQRGLETCR